MRSSPRNGLRLLVVAVMTMAACGTEQPAEEAPETAAPTGDAARDTSVQAAQAITIRPVSNIDPARFPHGAHETVECATCHTSVPGHASHAALGCAECHAAAVGARTRPTAAQCDACHHGPDQTRPCAACHGAAPPSTFQRPVTARFSVRQSDTRLTLPFDHDRHASQSCATCHTAEAGVSAVSECTTCHESHHDEARRCLTCHSGSALALHDRQAHLGCGGSDCHRDAAVTALDQTRQVCLVCHAPQEDHEPGLECALCHIVTDAAGSQRGPVPPASGANR